MTFHEGDGDHVHETTVGARGELIERIWKVENVELTTVGIDIGSSTSHLMFARVRLQRKTQALSSRFVVVERRILWKSPILMTPFVPDGTIDAAALGRFVAGCYRDAGLAAADIDTGAVILTGEAIKRTNARAIADLFAAESGKFVCASAGHHLEAALAAHGAGSVARSRESGQTILNVDIGGGTTKLALASKGEIVATAALAVGGRLDPRTPDHTIDALANAVISVIRGEPDDLAVRLMVTEIPPLPWERAGERVVVDAIAFSGGVSEYIYGRERREFGDIAPALARRIAAAFTDGRIATPLVEPAEGIRATVIGASQFSLQVSGKTIHLGAGAELPLRNVPVVAPRLDLGATVSATEVAAAVRAALERAPLDEGRPFALALAWRGDPHHARLHALAQGISSALALPWERAGEVLPPPWGRAGERVAPLILIADADVGRTLGHILEHELRVGRPIVSIDGVEVGDFDFVDIGALIRPADVVPVVVKSLLFAGATVHGRCGGEIRYQPLETKVQ